MLKRSHYIALGTVVLLTLVLLKLPNRTAAQLKLAISGLFLPLFGLGDSASQLTQKAGNAVVPRSELVRQLDELQKENQEMKIRVQQLDAVLRENSRFAQHLGVSRQFPWKIKLARVVARDPANWWRVIKIDLGLRDGVVTNSPVLTADGLVGRVSEVGYSQASVVLVGDPDCRVAVLIEETRENGVIAPSSTTPLDNSIVELGYLSRNSKLAAEQRVLTSGLGGIFPKGIFVGRLVDYRSVGYGLYNEARVKLAVRMNALEEVWVKMP